MNEVATFTYSTDFNGTAAGGTPIPSNFQPKIDDEVEVVEEVVIVKKPVVVEEKTKEGTPNTGITFDITLYLSYSLVLVV